MPTLSLRIIKKPRRNRWCDSCGKRLEGETIRLYGMAEYGDNPYALFLHRGCLCGTKELAMLEAAEHRLQSDAAPVKARVRKVIRPKILIDSDDLPRG